MRHIVIRGMHSNAIFSPHNLINGTILKKYKLLNTNCVLIFSINLSETFLITRRTERDMTKKRILVFTLL